MLSILIRGNHFGCTSWQHQRQGGNASLTGHESDIYIYIYIVHTDLSSSLLMSFHL